MSAAFGHRFADPELLRRALTHRSAAAAHNERLEFLGDALLNCIVAEALYLRWPRADEGALTRGRAALVRESALAELARGLQLGEAIQFGPGELKSGGHRRDSILADALEALVAAVYLDAGFQDCRACVLDWLQAPLAALSPRAQSKDAKTRLQEWLQARQLALPAYTLAEASGSEHTPLFRARCAVSALAAEAEGEGHSRRIAEQAAATALLAQLEARG